MNRLRELSADEERRRLAFVPERALHDEASLLHDAKRERLKQGLEEDRKQVARNLIAIDLRTDAQIAAASRLTKPEVKALRPT